MFTAAKDALASRAAIVWVNQRIARYGRVQDLKIDSRRRTVEISCLLDGELTPIAIKIGNYVVETEHEQKFPSRDRFQLHPALAAKSPDGFWPPASDRAAALGRRRAVNRPPSSRRSEHPNPASAALQP